MTLRLWQRNLVGAAVTAGALAVLGATDIGPLWATYRATVAPAQTVSAGASATVDGQTWSVGDVAHLGAGPRGGLALPGGTVLTVVTVNRSGPSPTPRGCTGVLTDGERRWRGEMPARYDVAPDDDAGIDCGKPGPLRWAFVTPDDAVPTAVDVTGLDGAILVRFAL